MRRAKTRTCAGTADKTTLSRRLTSPVATLATRLKSIMRERVARIQANFLKWEKGFFTAEVAEVRRGKRQEMKSFAATKW